MLSNTSSTSADRSPLSADGGNSLAAAALLGPVLPLPLPLPLPACLYLFVRVAHIFRKGGEGKLRVQANYERAASQCLVPCGTVTAGTSGKERARERQSRKDGKEEEEEEVVEGRRR